MDKCDDKIKPRNNKVSVYETYASLAFIVIIFIFGIPIWWKTTEISRENIPNSAIMELNNENIQISTSIFIYTPQMDRTKQLANQLTELFTNNTIFLLNITPIVPNNQYNVHTPAMLETSILKQHQLITGDFLFIEWQTLDEHILLTTERTAFMSNATIAIEMYDLLMAGPFKTFANKEFSSIATKTNINFELKSRPLEKEHEILISILNPKPEQINAKWNARKTFQNHLEPFLEHINQLSNFSIKTQWKYHVPFEVPLKKQIDNTEIGRHFILSENELPHIITSVEKYLGFGSDKKYQTHLVIYLLPCDKSPLYIYNKNNIKMNDNLLNSFLSLKWGGVIIYNPPIDVCLQMKNVEDKITFTIDSNEIMKTILYQLEKIFEIHTEVSLPGVKLIEKQSLLPRKWEFDATLRRNAIRYIATATKTLQSLVELLENISYIVINQNVASSINRAFENILLARENLLKSNLDEALLYAKEAFRHSEEVFFEASLLAQLYFPDEQKYAVYVPLFLPVMVPVLSSLPLFKKLRKSKVD